MEIFCFGRFKEKLAQYHTFLSGLSNELHRVKGNCLCFTLYSYKMIPINNIRKKCMTFSDKKTIKYSPNIWLLCGLLSFEALYSPVREITFWLKAKLIFNYVLGCLLLYNGVHIYIFGEETYDSKVTAIQQGLAMTAMQLLFNHLKVN